MRIKKKVLQKIVSVFASVLLLVNAFTPYLLIAPSFINQVKGQDVTAEPTETVIPEPTVEVTPTETPTPTVEVTPTSEPTVTPEPIPPQAPSQWTFEKVELNKEYIAPQNSEVKLTFTKLPNPSGNIKIEEITLTQEQIKQTGSLSDKAYDITSDMTDGSFSYNLSLPIPESSKGKSVEVKFAEELSNIGSATKVENDLTKTDTSVSVNSLDHFTIFVVTDQTPTAPLSSPDSSVQPRYISGFGLDNSYTIFYEDRNDTVGCAADTFRIHFMTTTNGPAGLSAPVQTDICDTHFTVKDWPITISGTTYAYRAWGAGANSGTHNFYVSNDLVNWTLANTFTFDFDHPSERILYGFHDIVKINDRYIGWVESNGSNTYIASSVNGDDHWTVGAQVGGATVGAAPLSLYFSPGITGPKPSGNFVLIELDGQLTYAKIYLAGDYSGAYMAINRVAAQAATPDLAEVAFMDPANWTWRDGTTGLPGLANTVIANTKASGGHDVREGWTVPMSDYQSNYVFLYSAEYSTGAKGLGYLVAATNPACTTTCYVNDATGIDTDDGASADNAKKTIQAAITQVSAGGTVNVAAGTYTEIGQIVINKNLSIVGADKATTIIKPAQDTGNDGSGNSRGWFLVNSGESFTLENVTLDGTGKNIHTGIRNLGNTTLTGNIIKNISYPGYFGFAVSSNYEAAGNTLLTVKNNTFSGYGRVGVHVDRGSGTSMGLIDNNIFIGKGEGDHLDYAIEVETGASATITNNDISNNKGITSIGGYTSAGILATTYYDSGTNITLTNNSIHDNSYGAVLGIGGSSDTTSVLQFDGNIFNSNTNDLDNSTVKNIDARNNTWSVVDQNNLDQIEEKINHYCSGSTYVHGVCNSGDDYGTGFGMVRYKDIGTPTNSGWNLQSKSATPNETPLDLVCSTSTLYTNENSLAQNWIAVSGTNIKYQREVTFPSSAISNFEAGSNTYTPFSSFGSGPGTEGLWKTKVRAYVDANGNNTYDSGEEVSGWSNECNITFDKTAPTVPINGTPNGTSISTNNFDFDWDNSTDNSPVTYLFHSSQNPASSGEVLTTGLWTSGMLPSSMIHSSGAGDGVWYWQVRATDAAGNTSA